MDEYPMLDQIDKARVTEAGGKAAILEEILRRWPKAPIPKFRIYTKKKLKVGFFQKKPRIFRESGDLDVFGAFGLYTTVHDVRYMNDNVEPILETPIWRKHRLKTYAESVGREYREPVVMSQLQGKPDFWAVIAEHPNRRECFLINYANRHSYEPFIGESFSAQINRWEQVADTYTAVCHPDNKIEGNLREESDAIWVYKAIDIFRKNRNMNIVHQDWVGIMEAGFYEEGPKKVEQYQFMPLRKRAGTESAVRQDQLIMGSIDEVTLPLIRMPHYHMVEGFAWGRIDSVCNPEFEAHINIMKESLGDLTENEELLFRTFIRQIEKDNPEGYAILAQIDKNQVFDLAMSSAKAVIISDVHENPLKILNHQLSRLIFKSPLLIVSWNNNFTDWGKEITISCDGSSYNVRW